jgi:hypothetical protein
LKGENIILHNCLYLWFKHIFIDFPTSYKTYTKGYDSKATYKDVLIPWAYPFLGIHVNGYNACRFLLCGLFLLACPHVQVQQTFDLSIPFFGD